MEMWNTVIRPKGQVNAGVMEAVSTGASHHISSISVRGGIVCGAPRKLPYEPVIGELESRTKPGSCDL